MNFQKPKKIIHWIFKIFGLRKVRLKQPDDSKYEESGFFEKSSDVYDHGYTYAYAERVNSKSQNNTKNSNAGHADACPIVPKAKGGYDSPVSFEILSDEVDKNSRPSEFTKLPQHYMNLTENSHKLNGSVRSNGTVPHQMFNYSSSDNVYDSVKYETSKI